MRAGRLDRRITIQRKTTTRSNSGAEVETWTTLVNRRPATAVPVRGGETFNNVAVIAQEIMEFWVRYSANIADLSPGDRVIYPALSEDSPEDEPPARHIYDVLALHETGRRDGIKIIAQRRPDVTS